MNIHINKHTRLQSWDGTTIFGDFPLHLRCGNLTVTLLFADADAIHRLHAMLADLLLDIEGTAFLLHPAAPAATNRHLTNGSFPDEG